MSRPHQFNAASNALANSESLLRNNEVQFLHFNGRSGLRYSTAANQVASPITYQPGPLLQQVRSSVGRLDLVTDLVCHRSLRHVARMIRLLPRPVPEGYSCGTAVE